MLQVILVIALSISTHFLLYSMKETDSLKNFCVNYIVEKLIKEHKDNEENTTQVHILPIELQELIRKNSTIVFPECNKANLKLIHKFVGNNDVSIEKIPRWPCDDLHIQVGPYGEMHPKCGMRCQGVTKRYAHIIKLVNFSADSTKFILCLILYAILLQRSKIYKDTLQSTYGIYKPVILLNSEAFRQPARLFI